MNYFRFFRFALLGALVILTAFPLTAQRNKYYITNQMPLAEQPYVALPIGTVKASGWLEHMLIIQKEGLTGTLDQVYPEVVGKRSGWLGGDGDGWERGPYWLDGLLPLAYLLDDAELKAKAQEWVEWSLNNQRADGYFGPLPFEAEPAREPGIQKGPREDWWPKMVMLKVLQQYYMATEDQRVVDLMDRYFQYQLKMLPENPLGKWSYWANRRGGDNLAMVYWLYNITGKKYLLELAELIHQQTFDWTGVYSGNMIRSLNPLPDLHCVNVAQGLKEPVIYYQQHPDKKYSEAVKSGLDALKSVHGFVNGMYGGDEQLHGNDPTQGSELCSAVEMMYSFELILPILGDVYYADYLEKIAFNVMPTQSTDDFTRRQYFQQVNQIEVADVQHNFIDDDNARMTFGVLTGYPCCTANMHQGWPKFVQSLWMASADNGLAALVYSASSVRAKVADGTEVEFVEETNYPFEESIRFKYTTSKSVKFSLHLRIPGWCKEGKVLLNGSVYGMFPGNQIIQINRKWEPNDQIELILPMQVAISRWAENSAGIERGPLVYALKMQENWVEVKSEKHPHSFWEVRSESPWNFLLSSKSLHPENFRFEEQEQLATYPWNIENAPSKLLVEAFRIDSWVPYRNSAGKIPAPNNYRSTEGMTAQEITLIPYGCTTLRIAQFPVLR